MSQKGKPDSGRGGQRRSILKNSEKTGSNSTSHRKSAHWDEENIQDTLHPTDKDYGYMQIDEPKTPYAWEDTTNKPTSSTSEDAGVNAGELKAKLQRKLEVDKEDTADRSRKKKAFEEKRKAHYNEARALRESISIPNDDEDEENENSKDESKSKTETKPSTSTGEKNRIKAKSSKESLVSKDKGSKPKKPP